MYETASLSRKEIQKKLRETTGNIFGKKKPKVPDDLSDLDTSFLEQENAKDAGLTEKKKKPGQKVKAAKVKKAMKKKEKKEKDSWESLEI